jgi:hypothetical protein
MIRTFFEAGAGFIAACAVASLVLVLFVVTPAELASLPMDQASTRISGILELAGLVAIQAALFSVPLVLAAGLLGELARLRAWWFYAGAGVVIAGIGYLAQQSGQRVGVPSLLNTYAAVAYLAAGFAGGMAYCAFRGRRAGRDRGAAAPAPGTTTSAAS